MKKIIVRTLISLAIILVVLLIIASTKPDNFRVERTLNVKASPESIAVLINDFHKWGSWSPYEKVDPSMKRTYSGADYGKGAIYEWDGNGSSTPDSHAWSPVSGGVPVRWSYHKRTARRNHRCRLERYRAGASWRDRPCTGFVYTSSRNLSLSLPYPGT